MEMNNKYSLWGGRFDVGCDELMKKFNESFSLDKRLWKQDLESSIAWAKAIEKVGILTKPEYDLIINGLEKIYDEWKTGKFVAHDDDEDIHTANERRLKEMIGDLAMKLHTGRSRNDQVVTDVRLWIKESLESLEDELKKLIGALVRRAQAEIDVIMPGYTHLQRAQPIRWSHLLLSYACPLDRNMQQLKQLKERVDSCPLGSGAIAGNPFMIDLEQLSIYLGFSSYTINSIDATANRDFITEFLFLNANISLCLSKLAEDFIIYSTKEFSFIRLSDLYCTGSSLMPQKRNSDSLELIRGKSGKLFGLLGGFMMTLKGIPTSYNKDLQEDKQAMFDSFDTVMMIVKISAGVIETLTVNKEKMLGALSTDLLATDLAYYLVRKGIPFRMAHSIAGQCVRMAEKNHCNLEDLKLDQLKSLSAFFGKDLIDIYDFEQSVEQYSCAGGTAKQSVLHQIEIFKKKYNLDD